MINKEIKQTFLLFLENRGVFFKPVHDGWYRTRCPYCGDTQKSLHEGHFYIKINLYDDYVMGFNCFRCGETGVINEETIELMGGSSDLKKDINILNKKSKRINKKQVISQEKLMYFDFKHSFPNRNKPYQDKKIRYIENRLNIDLSDNDISNFKIITSLSDFLKINNIKEYPFERTILNKIESKYVGFLSNGNSHIIFRDITDSEKFFTIKYPITKECMANKIFYSVKNDINIFTKDSITINLAEGVMDIIGVVKHFNQNTENTMNISVTGKYYNIMINRLVQMGFVGSNITINIYSDNDMMFGNSKNAYHTTMEYYKQFLSKYKYLYKGINIYYNMKAKDFGYPKENISIIKKKL